MPTKRDHTIPERHVPAIALLSLLTLLAAPAAWGQTTGSAGTGMGNAPAAQSGIAPGSTAPAQSGTAPANAQSPANSNTSASGTTGNQNQSGTANPPSPTATTPATPTTTPNSTQSTPNQPNSMQPATPPANANPAGIQGAGGASGTVFNLQQTIQMSLAASSSLQIANRNLDSDQAKVDQAEAGYRPQLDADGTWTLLNQPVKIKFAGGSPILVQPVDTENLNAALTLPIDITGQVAAQVQAARLNALADLYVRNRVVNQRILDSETSYLSLLRSQHQVDVAQASLDNAQTQYDTAQKQFNGGIGQRIDVYRAATQVAQAKQDLLSAQNQLAVAENNFNDLIGRPMASPVSVQDVSGVDVGIDVSGGAITPGTNPNMLVTPQTNLPKLYTPPASDTNMTIDQSVQAAMANRPELLQDKVNIEAAHRQIKIAHAGQEPTMSLSATSNYYPTTDFQNPYHSLDVVMATVKIPLYDAGVTRDKVREAKDAEANSKDQYSGDQSDVELQVRQAYLNLSTSRQQIDAANTALQQAIIARQLAQVRYANGVGLYLEVTDAQSALTTAETNQVNAVYNYLIAQAQFENAIGSPNRNPSL